MIKAKVDFSKKLRTWDGFGVNYVETCQTMNYTANPQEYGGFSTLSEEKRQEIISMIFGEDGLKPGLIKMFLDPFHQEGEKKNKPDPHHIDLTNYDHTTTTQWMRYFAKQGLEKIRGWGGDIEIITTLYGPPGWMTKQKVMRGRDLDPEFKVECAKYMISWVKYLREIEGLPVRYISLHNEGEDYHRWAYDTGLTDWDGHDYNMYWPIELVVDFIKFMRPMLDAQGLQDVGITPGETSNWYRFHQWGYADAIADDAEAVEKLGLITSHGFSTYRNYRWFGDHRSAGNDIIREKRPELHSWVTSTSWSQMDANFINELYNNIYSAKVNAIIPWATVQWASRWRGGDPNPGTAFNVIGDGTYAVQPGYYFFKQICRAGQPGTAVARTYSTETGVALMGFASNNTKNPDAFVVINNLDKGWDIEIILNGTEHKAFDGYRSSPDEKYVAIGRSVSEEGVIKYHAPAGSVTTFFGK